MLALTYPPRKLWTRAELDALESTGVLGDARYELIEGEVFDKTGQSPHHATAIHRLLISFAAVFGMERVRIQLPAEPAKDESLDSRPVPDALVSRESLTAHRERHPGPGDVILVAEVSDSALHFDSQRKARLYARAAFPEYVVIDLNRREFIVYRFPREDSYTRIQVLRPGESFYPQASPESPIDVSYLLGLE